MKVFISARLSELYLERKAAIEAIHIAGHTPVYIEVEPMVKDWHVRHTMLELLNGSDALVSLHYLSEGKRASLLDDRTPIEFELSEFMKLHHDAPVLLVRRIPDDAIMASPAMLHWFDDVARQLGVSIFTHTHVQGLSQELVHRLRKLRLVSDPNDVFDRALPSEIENLAPSTSLLTDATASRLVLASRTMWDELIRRLSLDPQLVHSLHPRAFEELVAELLTREGADVKLTSPTRDGGRDVLVYQQTSIGSHFYLVECKRYAPDRPVGVSIIRGFYGVIAQERATGGLLVTTSAFTASAVSFQKAIKHQLSLKDYSEVAAWIRRHNQQPS